MLIMPLLAIALVLFFVGSLIIGSSYVQARRRREALERRKKQEHK